MVNLSKAVDPVMVFPVPVGARRVMYTVQFSSCVATPQIYLNHDRMTKNQP